MVVESDLDSDASKLLVNGLGSKKKNLVEVSKQKIKLIFDSIDYRARWLLASDLYTAIKKGTDISFIFPLMTYAISVPSYGDTLAGLKLKTDNWFGMDQSRQYSVACITFNNIKNKKWQDAELFLKNEDSWVAWGAANAFADAAEMKINISKSFEALRIALSNEETVGLIDSGRKEISKGVMSKEGKSLFSGLGNIFNANTRLYVRSSSAKAFGFSARNGKNISGFITDLVTALFDNEQQVRESAAFALKEAEKKKYDLSMLTEIFNAMFSRSDINIRKRAAAALEEVVKAGLNIDLIVPVAIKYLNDREYIRKRIVVSLESFAKKNKKNAKLVLDGIQNVKADVNIKEIGSLVALCNKFNR